MWQDEHWNKLLWHCVDGESYKGCFLPEKEVIEGESGEQRSYGEWNNKWEGGGEESSGAWVPSGEWADVNNNGNDWGVEEEIGGKQNEKEAEYGEQTSYDGCSNENETKNKREGEESAWAPRSGEWDDVNDNGNDWGVGSKE